jgi:hypothetical protein
MNQVPKRSLGKRKRVGLARQGKDENSGVAQAFQPVPPVMKARGN